MQERIAEDPSLLGLGDLVLKDRERIQPRAGHLDLLLQDQDFSKRWEVEVQLGETDEAHIIRTIEYWDIERKRYPQYEHTAVIVAEDVTSRFLNVINLFNGHIPLVAIQMNALKIGDQISLAFTTILDEMPLGLVDEDEEVQEATDRSYWEDRASKATLSLADELLEILKEWDDRLELKYNKYYIGLARSAQPNNFVAFYPKRKWLRVEPKLERSGELEAKMEEEGLDLMDYHVGERRYRIRLAEGEVEEHRAFLRDLLRESYESSL